MTMESPKVLLRRDRAKPLVVLPCATYARLLGTPSPTGAPVTTDEA